MDATCTLWLSRRSEAQKLCPRRDRCGSGSRYPLKASNLIRRLSVVCWCFDGGTFSFHAFARLKSWAAWQGIELAYTPCSLSHILAFNSRHESQKMYLNNNQCSQINNSLKRRHSKYRPTAGPSKITFYITFIAPKVRTSHLRTTKPPWSMARLVHWRSSSVRRKIKHADGASILGLSAYLT